MNDELNVDSVNPKALLPVITVAGAVGKNCLAIIGAMRERAIMEKAIIEMDINGKIVRVDPFTPLWIIVRKFEE